MAEHGSGQVAVLTGEELLAAHPLAVLSHEEAARRLGLDLIEDDHGRRRVSVPRNTSRLRIDGWHVVRRDVPPMECLTLPDGSRVTAAARTVTDLASDLSLPAAVVLADSALRSRQVRHDQLLHVLSVRRGPGINRRRRVAELLDPRSGSVLESLLRVLLLTSDLPAPTTQFWVMDVEEPVLRADFAWPASRLIVEADGFAFHSDRGAYRRDRTTMNALERLGWRVLRFSYEDVVHRPGYVVGLVRACLTTP